MTPREVAQTLREISQLLQIKGENAFKVRAYDLGADAFDTLPADPAVPGGLYERVKNGTLTQLGGVGKAISEKVTELVNTGQLRYLDELRKEFPLGALDLMRIPGLGPRKAAVLIRDLDIGNLADLERACREHRVRGVKGFGERTEQPILEGIDALKATQARQPLYESRRIAEKLLARVRSAPGVTRAEIAGSVRRYKETNADVDLVAAAPDPAPVMDRFADTSEAIEVLARGPTKCSIKLRDGLQADLRVVTESQFASAFHHFTGSKQHHVKLRGIARAKGLSISEYGLARLDPSQGPAPEVRDQDHPYRILGLAPVPPEMREDWGEIELAAKSTLPELIQQRDIQGFVHCHTTWSDGNASAEEIAARWEELIELACAKGVAVECNGSPRRLDFGAELLRIARRHGCKVSCSVDAHSVAELENLHYSIGTARRGWTERDRVVNARGPDEFLSMLRA